MWLGGRLFLQCTKAVGVVVLSLVLLDSNPSLFGVPPVGEPEGISVVPCLCMQACAHVSYVP